MESTTCCTGTPCVLRKFHIRKAVLSADVDFSCFADLALTSPLEYFKEGQGSLLQCVLTPADKYMPLPNETICEEIDKQVTVFPGRLF